MPVITFANSKGGSGKTTTALLLGCFLAQKTGVTIIDADPRRPISSWAQKPGAVPERLSVAGGVTEENILELIEKAAAKDAFVIVDLEGTSSKTMGYAISASDFIVIPCKEQQQDAEAAVQVIKNMKLDFKMMRREIPFALLFTMTKYVKSRASKIIVQQFKESPIPTFNTEIYDRDAYSQIFLRGGTIYDLGKTSNNLEKAYENIAEFGAELIAKIRESEREAAA
ncbi:protein parA [Asticcacaulis biprosthecium C19]|jgi:chromosome partitioning protein|uniref:Protein parA n=1 Tax=Asticcacaulis biprosthecium C19 TaxID=715226 RepID=F4QG24_9CAUL|nr:ParA family protein [Asticcacaulis biprosthecium]EGF93835.1 protein parA [Asticcacaulis biprosthecium C19]